MLSSNFRPTMSGTTKTITGYTVTGQAQYSTPTLIKFAPIRLQHTNAPTSIRTDKSGSKSRAGEETLKGRILVHPDYTVSLEDIVTILDVDYIVDGVFPRFSMDGGLQHIQVDLRI